MDREALAASLSTSLASPTVSGLQKHVTLVLDEGLGLVLSRAALGDFVSSFTSSYSSLLSGDSMADEAAEKTLSDAVEVWRFVLERTSGRQVAFEEQISLARFSLAAILEFNEEWSEAAKVLMQIPLDSGHRHVDDLQKAAVYVRIVRLLLEDEDSVSAESYLNRASLVVNKPEFEANKSDEALVLTLQFKAAQAVSSTLSACSNWLPQSTTSCRTWCRWLSRTYTCLVQAVVCAILAPAGPGRSRLLATLYKDERTRESPECSTLYYPILSKMYLDRILRVSEIAEFRETLRPHQLARLSDGMTVLDRAVIEHNVVAASKIYTSIKFSQLSGLLGVPTAEAAESVVARMVGEGRVDGTIDQMEGMVYFEESTSSSADAMSLGIRGVCEQVDGVVEEVMNRNPEWVQRILSASA
ncbi:PCI-domain-containing protein [Rhizoclosmatium globosum]|uniref:COP9 signalosome complex subunit 4 n=1 Tax=Rhizoclosmatium globosum TaxID=329046 RepID=A0A1Y2BFE8_9FUNG|nr:PCI-domain-containing protein [Rhizoclosmatium globosum]|eukprot:ORY33542.1 PCI-domain-containing protein [Rhizoclosmatium globosum]